MNYPIASVGTTRSRRRSASLLLVGLLAVSACGEGDSTTSDDVELSSGGTTPDTAVAVAADPGPVSNLPPNELGEILVLEYHRLGESEGEFVRKGENFQKDLETLYAAGYRPLTMRQLLEGDINVPAGTTPVVFTIDDSSLGQFYYLPDGTIDPASMAGMWDTFQKANTGWRNGAVWCVLPAADYPSNFFGEKPTREVPREEREATIRKKVDYLLQNGHEICNHTLYHARLDRAENDAQVLEWIGRGEDSIKVYLPADYDIVTFALPLGMWPKNRALAVSGTWPGRAGQNRPVSYSNQAILEVSGDDNPSPFDLEFDPHSIDRFIVAPDRLERQLAAYERDPSRRFISDGNPAVISVPQSRADRVDRARWTNKEVRVVPDAPAPATPPAP